MSDIDAIQNALQTLSSLPAQLKAQNDTIVSLRVQLQESAGSLAVLRQEQDNIQSTKERFDEELKAVKLAHDLVQKQRDAAISRQEALEKAREADKYELDALREEVRQLKAQRPRTSGEVKAETSDDTQPQLAILDAKYHKVEKDEDCIIIDDDESFKSEPNTRVPEKWQLGLSVSRVEVPPDVGEARFTRSFLSQQLGGSTQGVIMRVSKQNVNVVLKEFRIERYYCPNKNGNPYLPSQPGEHGFLFIGMSKADQTVGLGECCEVFVGMGTNDWRYFGSYRFTRVAPLTAEDFNLLPAADQVQYCKFTVQKKLADTEQHAKIKYKNGELRVPCVRMECIAFNQDFFDKLRANFRVGTAGPKRGHAIVDVSPARGDLHRTSSSSVATESPVRVWKKRKISGTPTLVNLYDDDDELSSS